MVNGTQFNELAAQQLVRYEALFKLVDEIETTEDITVISSRIASQWKYFANVNRWRLVIIRDRGFTVIQGLRGEADVSEVSELSLWDLHHYTLQRPRLIRNDNLIEGPNPPDSLVGNDIPEIKVFPFTREDRCIGLLNVASRHDPFTELDNKFIRIFGNYIVSKISDILFRKQATEALVTKATRDALTGLLNRGIIIEKLGAHIALARRFQKPMSVVLADIDHFKTINDTYGHLAGDNVLREVSKRLQAQVRAGDMIGRYGGEEFLFVLYPCNNEEIAIAAERFRKSIAEAPIIIEESSSDKIDVSISLGTATTYDNEISIEKILKQADDALYMAKTQGRNRVVVYERSA